MMNKTLRNRIQAAIQATCGALVCAEQKRSVTQSLNNALRELYNALDTIDFCDIVVSEKESKP